MECIGIFNAFNTDLENKEDEGCQPHHSVEKREEMYSENYDHSTIDVAESFYGILQQLRISALLKESEGSVLDVGCADFPLLSWFAETRKSLVVGVDVVIPPKILEAKSQRCNFVNGVAEYLPFRRNSFDTVVMGEVIEHIIDLQKVIAEACRFSRFKIFLSTPNRISNPLAKFSPDHLRSFSHGTLSNFLGGLHLSMKSMKQPIFPLSLLSYTGLFMSGPEDGMLLGVSAQEK